MRLTRAGNASEANHDLVEIDKHTFFQRPHVGGRAAHRVHIMWRTPRCACSTFVSFLPEHSIYRSERLQEFCAHEIAKKLQLTFAIT